MGATTVWERWDSMLPGGTINPGEMTSFNDYALGAVADWMHRTIGGIAPARAGMRERARRAPARSGLTWARSALDSPHERIEVAWTRTADRIEVELTVPEGVTATVRVPREVDVEVGEGHASRVDDIDSPGARGQSDQQA
jgi:alpha-L-rhamnosidase